MKRGAKIVTQPVTSLGKFKFSFLQVLQQVRLKGCMEVDATLF